MQCQLINYLNEHDFITPDQSAYRKYHSTASCLHTSIDEWLQNIEDHYVTGVVFFIYFSVLTPLTTICCYKRCIHMVSAIMSCNGYVHKSI